MLRLAFLLLLLPALARAQVLVLGVGAPVSSLDPHFHLLRSNNEVAQMIFDPLLRTDAQGRLRPGLAEAWAPHGEAGWDLTLREGLRFHDGTPLEAEDVAFTFARIGTIAGPGASFAPLVRAVQRVEVLDPRRIRLHTAGPAPLLPTHLTQVMILSRRLHAEATTAEFNAGRAAIGTGPFRLERHLPGDRITLARNDAWWGGAAPWAQVTYRMITNDAARTAALLAGDVDMIDQVSTGDRARLRGDARFRVAQATSLRVMYLTLDGTRDGPLADRRVREALSLALDRRAIVERVMEGAALATAQLMPPGMPDHLPERPVPVPDPERARRLLAEAGFPQGFPLTLIGSNDRYMNDARVVQAVGQMWTRIGVRTTVEAQPYAVFIGRATRREAPAALLSWGNSTGEVSVLLASVLRTPDRARGHGVANRIGTSNPAVDALITRAEREMDDAARAALLREATVLALDDAMLVPLYLQSAVWAMRAGLAYEPRMDERNDPLAVTGSSR